MYIQRSVYIREVRLYVSYVLTSSPQHTVLSQLALRCSASTCKARAQPGPHPKKRCGQAKMAATCYVLRGGRGWLSVRSSASHHPMRSLGLPRCRTGRRSTRRWSSSRSRFPKRESSQRCRYAGPVPTGAVLAQSSANCGTHSLRSCAGALTVSATGH